VGWVDRGLESAAVRISGTDVDFERWRLKDTKNQMRLLRPLFMRKNHLLGGAGPLLNKRFPDLAK
jgi:hypothetical protein